MIFVPYGVDAPLYRAPLANYLLAGATIVLCLFFWSRSGFIDSEAIFRMDRPAPSQTLRVGDWVVSIPSGQAMPSSGQYPALGQLFAHRNLFHLLFNMIYLLVFGNAVCAKIGNLRYLALYLAGGLAGALAQRIFGADPVVGASGAVNAVIGAYLLLYPMHMVRCLLIFWGASTVPVHGFIIVLFRFAFDLLGLLRGWLGIGYGAHVGGLLFGAGVMALALRRGWVKTDEPGDQSFFQVLEKRRERAAWRAGFRGGDNGNAERPLPPSPESRSGSSSPSSAPQPSPRPAAASRPSRARSLFSPAPEEQPDAPPIQADRSRKAAPKPPPPLSPAPEKAARRPGQDDVLPFDFDE